MTEQIRVGHSFIQSLFIRDDPYSSPNPGGDTYRGGLLGILNGLLNDPGGDTYRGGLLGILNGLLNDPGGGVRPIHGPLLNDFLRNPY